MLTALRSREKCDQLLFARANHPIKVTTSGNAPPDQILYPMIIATLIMA